MFCVVSRSKTITKFAVSILLFAILCAGFIAIHHFNRSRQIGQFDWPTTEALILRSVVAVEHPSSEKAQAIDIELQIIYDVKGTFYLEPIKRRELSPRGSAYHKQLACGQVISIGYNPKNPRDIGPIWIKVQ